MPVNYDKHDFDSCFYDKNNRREEMWWKSSEYRYQHEGRIVIPGVHFRQRYSDVQNYNWEKNLLKVHLPNLEDYSFVFDGAKHKYASFSLDDCGGIKINPPCRF